MYRDARLDDRARLAADRAAARARGRGHDGDQLGHLLPAARAGRQGVERAAWARARLPRSARAASRRRRAHDLGGAGTARDPGPKRRARARRGRRARLARRAAAPQRPRLPRRHPVRDRLSQQRQGRRPPERAAAGLRGGGADRSAGCGRRGSRSRPAARSASMPRRPAGAPCRLRAPAVVVACGAIETPPLLRRSGLGRHPRLGRGLSIHPALGVTGSFAEPVYAWRGVMQSVGIEELHEREGVLLEATADPAGDGRDDDPRIRRRAARAARPGAEHSAALGAMIADAALRPRPRRSPADRRLPARPRRPPPPAGGARGMRARAARRRRRRGSSSARDRRRSAIPRTFARPSRRSTCAACGMAAFHPTGTAAAGSDPSRHPVDPDGRLRGAEGVWVADASILPSCPRRQPADLDHGSGGGCRRGCRRAPEYERRVRTEHPFALVQSDRPWPLTRSSSRGRAPTT